MLPQVDIQMPLREGSFVVGDVLQSLLKQDLPFTLYMDSGPDLPLPSVAQLLLQLVADSPQQAERIAKSSRAAFKRNRLRECGSNDYVYLADPDVLLPDAPFFQLAVEYLSTNPRIGAIGMCYHTENDHVGCGSMMLRREDLLALDQLRGTGKSCICSYIQSRLKETGLATVPIRTVRAIHLKRRYQGGYTEYRELRYTLTKDKRLPREDIERMLEEHGPQFKLFVSHPEEAV